METSFRFVDESLETRPAQEYEDPVVRRQPSTVFESFLGRENGQNPVAMAEDPAVGFAYEQSNFRLFERKSDIGDVTDRFISIGNTK